MWRKVNFYDNQKITKLKQIFKYFGRSKSGNMAEKNTTGYL